MALGKNTIRKIYDNVFGGDNFGNKGDLVNLFRNEYRNEYKMQTRMGTEIDDSFVNDFLKRK